LSGRAACNAFEGDVLVVETPGGGGFGQEQTTGRSGTEPTADSETRGA
jgi:N-methylhydantoinase B/oxoprolinase/acetone carboxylase alpha subunit